MNLLLGLPKTSSLSIMKIFTLSLFTIVLLASCNKEPGRGGTSSISGKLYVYDINGIGDTIDEYYAMDEDVYIIYGDKDLTYDDKFRCSYDGSFRFDYLTEGTYTLYAYSRCDTCPDGKTAVTKTIQIQEKKKVVEVPNLNILK